MTELNTDALLVERGKTHGDFADHAAVTQSIKSLLAGWHTYRNLSDIQKESLEMIAHKIGRILAGNPNHHDHWFDISGYAMLVADRLPK
jgi:hypothetical protein